MRQKNRDLLLWLRDILSGIGKIEYSIVALHFASDSISFFSTDQIYSSLRWKVRRWKNGNSIEKAREGWLRVRFFTSASKSLLSSNTKENKSELIISRKSRLSWHWENISIFRNEERFSFRSDPESREKNYKARNLRQDDIHLVYTPSPPSPT